VPYTKDKKTGRGVAWGNSLFEDNAEYGLGSYLAVKHRREQLRQRIEAALQGKNSEKLSRSLRSGFEQWLLSSEDSVCRRSSLTSSNL
jgi:pyruvate-ferredoxin/flavodoxin oxidoreductase